MDRDVEPIGDALDQSDVGFDEVVTCPFPFGRQADIVIASVGVVETPLGSSACFDRLGEPSLVRGTQQRSMVATDAPSAR